MNDDYLDDEEGYEPTKGELREQRRNRKRYGMVPHLEPTIRPFDQNKVRKPKIHFKGE